MIVAPQLSCSGCYCAAIRTEGRAEFTGEMDWTGKEFLLCSSHPLLSVQPQVNTDAPLMGTLRARFGGFHWLRHS